MAGTGRPPRDYVGFAEQVEQQISADKKAAIKPLRDHFLKKTKIQAEGGAKSYAAMLAYTTTTTLDDAIGLLMEGTLLRHGEAEKILLSAINAAPTEWKNSQEQELVGRGLIRGVEDYYKIKRLHGAGTDFDTIRKNIPATREPIMRAAVDGGYAHWNKYGVRLTDSALKVVAVQLLEPGEYKDGVFAKIRKGPSRFDLAVKSSETAIKAIAEDMKIDPSTLPPFYDLDGGKTLAGKMNYAAQKAAKQEEASADPQYDLKVKLEGLVRAVVIDELDRDVYLYAITDNAEGKRPSEMQIISKFTYRSGPKGVQEHRLKLEKLREIMVKVPNALNPPKPAEPALKR